MAVGYVCHARDLSAGTLQVYAYELADDVSWLEANPFVLNTLAQAAEERPDSLTFSLGQSHPLYSAFPDPPLYDLDRDGHYSFYVRVPDLPTFLRQVAPVLEERLSNSVAVGHTATLELTADCDLGDAREVSSRVDGARRYNRPGTSAGRYTDRIYYVYPGACTSLR